MTPVSRGVDRIAVTFDEPSPVADAALSARSQLLHHPWLETSFRSEEPVFRSLAHGSGTTFTKLKDLEIVQTLDPGSTTEHFVVGARDSSVQKRMRVNVGSSATKRCVALRFRFE